MVALRYSARINGFTSLAITRMDTLEGIDKLKICVGYELDGEEIDYIPASLKDLERVKPIYKEFDGWTGAADITNYDELPENAKKYLDEIEAQSGLKISLIGVGPERNQCIKKNEVWA